MSSAIHLMNDPRTGGSEFGLPTPFPATSFTVELTVM